jgi:hypothetical protein
MNSATPTVMDTCTQPDPVIRFSFIQLLTEKAVEKFRHATVCQVDFGIGGENRN